MHELSYRDRLNVFRNPNDDAFAIVAVQKAIDCVFSRCWPSSDILVVLESVESCLEQRTIDGKIEDEFYKATLAEDIKLRLFIRMQIRLHRIALTNNWSWEVVLFHYAPLLMRLPEFILKNAIQPNRLYLDAKRDSK